MSQVAFTRPLASAFRPLSHGRSNRILCLAQRWASSTVGRAPGQTRCRSCDGQEARQGSEPAPSPQFGPFWKFPGHQLSRCRVSSSAPAQYPDFSWW